MTAMLKGTSSGEVQSVSTTPEAWIRSSAPFGGASGCAPAAAAACTTAEGAIAKLSVTVTSGIIPESILQLPPSSVGSAIEIEGNLIVDGANGRDWANLPSSVFSCTSNPKVGCDVDLPTGKNDNSFGQGTKEDDLSPTVVRGSIPNNKSDLRTFHVYRETSTAVGHPGYLNMAWSRVTDPTGTTLMDFEFNQSSTNCASASWKVALAWLTTPPRETSKSPSKITVGFRQIRSGSSR